MVETTSQASRVLTIRILSLVSGLATLLLSYFLEPGTRAPISKAVLRAERLDVDDHFQA